ncbi:protein lplB [Gordoniibacillus kamchatkensis]|uniref:Protein lplB n=1 Tax=Gordoniibacillus kamchatkensis TaxID=1590651 RepID=A0ABR5AEA4_9BACL|nr:ABC transporter permease subunit [Paenibacillus sp. VKM B-2647]KIL39018.1 protein lplB [Paenibacillus sp. VKM B-2647]
MESAMHELDALGTKAKKTKLQLIKRRFYRERQLWFLCIPILFFIFVMQYIPIFGDVIAFMNYIPGQSIWSSEWVGLQHFKTFFESPDFPIIMRNTLAISGLNILFGFPAPIILALLLNELRSKPLRKFVQSTSYLPYFLSWVVVASIAFLLFGNEGVLNEFLQRFGIIKQPISFLGDGGKYYWGILTSLSVWKNVGWNSIIYLSAITSVDPELYDAGKVDGLGRFKSIWHITLPSIRPTIVVLWILSMGNIFSAGLEAPLLIGNAQTRDYSEVIDTYVFKYGLELGNYSFATAIELVKGIIAVSLVFAANRFTKKVMDTSIY